MIENGAEWRLVYPAHSGLEDARHLTQGDARPGLACPGLRNIDPLGLRMAGVAVSSGFRRLPSDGEARATTGTITMKISKAGGCYMEGIWKGELTPLNGV